MHALTSPQDPPDWQEILKYFRGSELQNYFTKVLEDNLKALIKPQYVDHIPRAIKGTLSVSQMLDSKLERDNKQKMCDDLELNDVLTREVSQLSGGELQRFAIAMSCIQKADVCVAIILAYLLSLMLAYRYMFDEPSSYLDIKQRLKAAEVIRELLTPDNYVIAVEHDLSVLDYLSDFICCLYGKPSMYGVVTMPYSVREGKLSAYFELAALHSLQASTSSWMASSRRRTCGSVRRPSPSRWSRRPRKSSSTRRGTTRTPRCRRRWAASS